MKKRVQRRPQPLCNLAELERAIQEIVIRQLRTAASSKAA